MLRSRHWSVLAVVAFLGFLSGCGSNLVPVEGIVTLDGKPVEGAMVTFVMDGKSGDSASGMTDGEGIFHLSTTADRKGVAPGNYKVLVFKSGGGFSPWKHTSWPREYMESRTTPLQCTVPPSGKVILELKSAGN